jgi:hypothetical protein
VNTRSGNDARSRDQVMLLVDGLLPGGHPEIHGDTHRHVQQPLSDNPSRVGPSPWGNWDSGCDTRKSDPSTSAKMLPGVWSLAGAKSLEITPAWRPRATSGANRPPEVHLPVPNFTHAHDGSRRWTLRASIPLSGRLAAHYLRDLYVDSNNLYPGPPNTSAVASAPPPPILSTIYVRRA